MTKTSKRSKSKNNESNIREMGGNSYNPQQEILNLLRTECPEVFTEGKIDVKKLRRSLGEELSEERERYGLNWAGKSDCFRHIQETTTATLIPCKEESVDFDNTENLFIEGDNLQVLKVLQKSYYNKIKMIYIDPPYNTGNDSFIYPDRFAESKEDYLQRIGDKDAEGNLIKDGFWRKNSKDTGHFHSNWLSMMYPRLFLARNLLRDDGVIFVSINDNETHNLKMIMNEIFGEENFVVKLVWENKEGGGGSDSKFFRVKHEYILCYARNIEALEIIGIPISNETRYTLSDEFEEERGKYYLQKLNQASIQYSESLDYPVETPDGNLIYPKQGSKKACWRWSKTKLDWGLKNKYVEFKKDKKGLWQLYSKQYLKVDNEGNPIHRTNRPMGVIEKFSSTLASKQSEQLLGNDIFQYPKPYQLIKYLIYLISKQEKDIILDFFSGSCTTAEAVWQLNTTDKINRNFICSQLPEPCEEDSEARKNGYKTIADIGKERIRRAANKIKEENGSKLNFDGKRLDLGFKVFKLADSNFKQWRGDIKTGKLLAKQMSLFVDNVKPDILQENVLYELILKTGLDLNVKVEAKKVNGKQYFVIDGGKLIICLEKSITKSLIDKILKIRPEKFICLDRAFESNDQLKTNTALQMESEKIEFKVI